MLDCFETLKEVFHATRHFFVFTAQGADHHAVGRRMALRWICERRWTHSATRWSTMCWANCRRFVRGGA
jgi:hypothetical protein